MWRGSKTLRANKSIGDRLQLLNAAPIPAAGLGETAAAEPDGLAEAGIGPTQVREVDHQEDGAVAEAVGGPLARTLVLRAGQGALVVGGAGLVAVLPEAVGFVAAIDLLVHAAVGR